MKSQQPQNKINTRKSILLRGYLVFAIAGFFAAAVLFAAARLQLGSDEEFSEALRQKNSRVIDVHAIRGNIYADQGRLLATSVPTYNLVFDSRADGLTNELFKSKIDSLSLKLAAKFPEKNAGSWKNYLQYLRYKKSRYTIIRKDLSYLTVKEIKKWPLISLGKFKSGFWWEEKSKRMYFMGELAKRTIGYSKQGIYVGLEGAFDSLLRGTDGKRMEQRMPGNVWRPVQVGNYKDPVNGHDIITTLDINLQDVAQHALNKVLTENEADHGCAVVMEVKTGAIRAMANLKRNKDGLYSETQNFAVDEFSEPGSTFKLVSVMALLNDGHCGPNDSIDIEWGKTSFYGQKMEDASKPHKTTMTLQEIFEKSSNVGISKLVVKNYHKDPQKFIDYALDLGLNIKPDFDIRSAGNPRIKSKKSSDWSATSLPWMSIGYEIKVSPMQILMLYNAVANNGQMVKPYMVSEIHREGQLIQKIEPVVLKEKICSEQTIKSLKSMMEGVVDHGTATNVKNPNYTVAGKTGTAQISKAGGYDKSSYKASFVGYFPAENPQYTVIVVINEPRKGKYYGALVAGPVFKEIADKIFSSNVNLHPEIEIKSKPQLPESIHGHLFKSKTVLNGLGISARFDSPADSSLWIKSTAGEYALSLFGIQKPQGKIPDARGMGLRDAIQFMNESGIKVSFEGYGKVVKQTPAPGEPKIAGQKVHLILSVNN